MEDYSNIPAKKIKMDTWSFEALQEFCINLNEKFIKLEAENEDMRRDKEKLESNYEERIKKLEELCHHLQENQEIHSLDKKKQKTENLAILGALTKLESKIDDLDEKFDEYEKESELDSSERNDTQTKIDKICDKIGLIELGEGKKDTFVGGQIPFDNNSEIIKFLEDDEKAKALEKYFLDNHPGKLMWSAVITKSFSINMRIEIYWFDKNVGSKKTDTVPEEFKTFCQKLFIQDENLMKDNGNNVDKIFKKMHESINNNRHKLKKARDLKQANVENEKKKKINKN